MILWPRLRSPRRRLSDRHLAATIKVRLENDKDVAISEPVVRVKAGVVLLLGRVSKEHQKHLAAGIASSMPGVRAVFNELRVGDSSV